MVFETHSRVRIVCATLLLHVYKLTGREQDGAVRSDTRANICVHLSHQSQGRRLQCM